MLVYVQKEMESQLTILWLLRCIAVVAMVAPTVSGAGGTYDIDSDRRALMEFKANIVGDPNNVLSSWNSSQHVCRWFGVTCTQRHQRVARLELQSQNLSGTISPYVGNLSFLRVLDLENNSFVSNVPPEIGRLLRLRILYLNNNSLSGTIPPSLSGCSNLVRIDLSTNLLEGKVPANLSFLSKIERFYIWSNNLNGEIPYWLGNLSSLVYLDWSYNKLEGRIPDTFGNLRNLKGLYLGGNKLVGDLPSSITNISSLVDLVLNSNQLIGTLPPDLGINLPNLQRFSIFDNQFSGPIPKSISNMSQLLYLQIAINNFTGELPSFGKMTNLYMFTAFRNYMGSGKPNDIDFLCSLTNSTSLNYLEIGQNNLGGEIPKCIGNLSINLGTLVLEQNALSGNFPSSISNLINLEVLSFSYNNISGSIPPEIGNLKWLGILYLENCSFTGEIPRTLGNLSMLTHLALWGNSLEGVIPSSLSNLQSLLILNLAYNKLTGAIPSEIMRMSSLSIYADFSHNNLSGKLPLEIAKLKNLGDLRLHGNKFYGEIPSSLGDCISLEYLYMQDNMFTGSIPSTLSSLKGLQELNLSHNSLSGQIPELLENLNLTSLDLSYNNFEGELPTGGIFANASATSVLGNEKLCGGVAEYQLPKCKSSISRSTRGSRARNVSIYAVSGILAAVLVLSLFFFIWWRKHRKPPVSSASDDEFLRVSYQDLLKATDGFSSANLIGAGSFGSVFKGILPLDQAPIAVKVLNLDHHCASKSFIAECDALRNIRHRNLVRVLTACSGTDYKGNDFKALVYEFMENGTLEEWLHPPVTTHGEQRDTTRKFGLVHRVNIAADIACALDYLHHQCETPIVHCDLKPSNVLLDGEMTGHVGDFGLVRFIPEATRKLISDQTSSIGVKGSIGYIAPEYGAGGEVTTNGDVYSFGILILEMFTGKRPTDDMFVDGLSLHSYSKSAIPERVLEITDPGLIGEIKDEDNSEEARQRRSRDKRLLAIIECLVSIVEMGVVCSSEVPRDRMSMRDVAAALQAIGKKLDGV